MCELCHKRCYIFKIKWEKCVSCSQKNTSDHILIEVKTLYVEKALDFSKQ